MTKHILVPNNFYFMKPNKIVKRQISLFAYGQAHLTADHFFSQAHLNSHCSPFIMNFKKKKQNKTKQKLDQKMSMHLKIVKVK